MCSPSQQEGISLGLAIWRYARPQLPSYTALIVPQQSVPKPNSAVNCVVSCSKCQVFQVEREKIASLEVPYCFVPSVPRCRSMAEPRAPPEPLDSMNRRKWVLLVCFHLYCKRIEVSKCWSISVVIRSAEKLLTSCWGLSVCVCMYGFPHGDKMNQRYLVLPLKLNVNVDGRRWRSADPNESLDVYYFVVFTSSDRQLTQIRASIDMWLIYRSF